MPTEIIYKPRPDTPLEMSTLRDDNRSFEAQAGIREFEQAQGDGCTVIVAGCGDARRKAVKTYNTNRIIEMRAIAAAINGNPSLEYMLNHPGVAAVMSGQHFDQETLNDPQVLERGLVDCGGLYTKAARERNGDARAIRGVQRFVDVEIQSSNIFVQALSAAANLAAYTDKPVVAYVEDHRSLRVYPIGVLSHRGSESRISIPLGRLNDWHYILKEEIIPELDIADLPESVQGLLAANKQVVAEITPEFYESQKVQDPEAVVLTTSSIPVGTRYPHLLREPNRSFDLFLQYEKSAGKVTGIDADSLKRLLEQAQYPLSHASKAEVGKSFFSTSTVLIETPSMDMSEYILGQMLGETWMEEWLVSGHRRVWLAEIAHGETKEMLELIRT